MLHTDRQTYIYILLLLYNKDYVVQYLIVGTASGLKSSIVAGLIGTQTRPKRIKIKNLKIKNLTNQKSYTSLVCWAKKFFFSQEF